MQPTRPIFSHHMTVTAAVLFSIGADQHIHSSPLHLHPSQTTWLLGIHTASLWKSFKHTCKMDSEHCSSIIHFGYITPLHLMGTTFPGQHPSWHDPPHQSHRVPARTKNRASLPPHPPASSPTCLLTFEGQFQHEEGICQALNSKAYWSVAHVGAASLLNGVVVPVNHLKKHVQKDTFTQKRTTKQRNQINFTSQRMSSHCIHLVILVVY